MNRSVRHVLLAAGSAAAALAANAGVPAAAALDRASLMTSWLCLGLFTAALLVGPVHVLRTGRLLTNSLLRRDLGIWCAITGLAHLALAFGESMNPGYIQVYVDGAAAWPGPAARRQLYFLSVVASLVVAALFALLLALSSNRAIRWLGPLWWKRLQRASYPAFALTVSHGVAFQLIESRTRWLIAALALLTATVAAAQLAAWSRIRSARRLAPGT